MSRLQKKCVLGATTMHALLLLALLVGPAFFTKKEEPLDLVELTFIPSILTDSPHSNPGGAAPGGQTRAQPEPQPRPQPTPPTPELPQVREPVVEPEPVKPPKPQPKAVEPDEPKINDRDSDKVQKPKPKQVVVSNKRVSLANRNTSTSKPTSTSNSSAASNNNSALASAIRSTRGNLGSGLSSGTDVRMPPGQGGGSGASYANYNQEIQRIYKAAYDRALMAVGDIADGQRPEVETSIVILRNGTVLNSSITKPSGNAELNKLVRGVLNSIREVPAFPAGATDSRRTLNIIFDLKPKLNLG